MPCVPDWRAEERVVDWNALAGPARRSHGAAAMHVGYVYEFNSYPPRDGGSIHVYNLVRSLVALGCTVHTCGFEENPQCVTYPPDGEGVRRFLSAIDVLYMRIDSRFLSRSALRRRCLEGFARGPVVWEINAPAEEMVARFRLGPNGAADESGTHGGRMRAWARNLRLRTSIAREERFRRRQARRVHAAVCVSNALKQYAAADLGIQTCAVIPNASDPVLFAGTQDAGDRLQDYGDHFKVIYSGDFHWPWQGFEFVKSLAELAQRRGENMLFVVLNNSPSEAVRSEGRVLVFNRVPYFEVPSYLASADACLCTYRDFSWSRYGFYLSPLKLFDYMASGKPVVASGQGQIAEVIEHGRDGLLTTNAISDAYNKLLFCMQNRDQARRMGQSAREKVIRFYNWERVARATIEVFESLGAQARGT